MTFPCTRCGLCCQHVGHVAPLAYLDRGDGVCTYYSSVEGCSIYGERPLLCRVDESYDALMAKKMSRQAFYQLNADGCNELQATNGLSTELRVKP